MTIQTSEITSVSSKRTTFKVMLVCWLSILFEGYDVGVMGAVYPHSLNIKSGI